MQPRTIMVLGATGLMGRRIAEHLAIRFPDAEIIGAARHATAQSAEFPGNIHPFDIDLETPESFGPIFPQVSDLVIAVAGRPGRFGAIEHTGVVAAANAALEQGVRRIVHITGTAAPQAPDWFEAGAAKKRAEAAIQALPARVTTLRPSWLMEALPRFERSGGMAIFGSGETPIHWLALDDLAAVVSQVLDMPETDYGAYPVLGPDAVPLRDAASRYAHASGMKPDLRCMPMPLARLLATVSTRPRYVVQLSRVFDSFDEGPLAFIETPFGRPKTTLDQWLRQSLGHDRADG